MQYSIEHPSETKQWDTISKYIVILGVKDRDTLLDYADIAYDFGRVSMFIEPDYGDEHTAFACILNPEQAKKFSQLPLLLRSLPEGGEV